MPKDATTEAPAPAQQYTPREDRPPRPVQSPFEIDTRIILRLDHDTAELLLEALDRGIDPANKRMVALTRGLENKLRMMYDEDPR